MTGIEPMIQRILNQFPLPPGITAQEKEREKTQLNEWEIDWRFA